MDIISIEEMLWHYVARVNLALENLDQHQKDLKEVMELLEDSYQTEISKKIQLKLQECDEETERIQTHFEDARYFLRREINQLEELMIL